MHLDKVKGIIQEGKYKQREKYTGRPGEEQREMKMNAKQLSGTQERQKKAQYWNDS